VNAISSLQMQLKRAQDELVDLSARMTRVRIKVEVLEEALREISAAEREAKTTEAVNPEESSADVKSIGGIVISGISLLKPTQAILDFLKINSPSSRGDIISALKDRIDSMSDNKPHIIRTCLHQLVDRGLVIQSGEHYAIRRGA
jgi:hypothetical protein